jgi:hypothetical protein
MHNNFILTSCPLCRISFSVWVTSARYLHVISLPSKPISALLPARFVKSAGKHQLSYTSTICHCRSFRELHPRRICIFLRQYKSFSQSASPIYLYSWRSSTVWTHTYLRAPYFWLKMGWMPVLPCSTNSFRRRRDSKNFAMKHEHIYTYIIFKRAGIA